MFSEDFDGQVDQLDKVLTQTGSAGLKLKASKCVFFAMKMSFLGHNPDAENSVCQNPELAST